ncbi:hypothetical protein BCR33DRAFT_819649 [Rhizoclosmatium globosum]|uniref:Uncharacterized protein n=1 Tax=Rhizoclosmatium globosum TaxID=329046 RepID=A0A1Y2ACY5_9FUNG|nr:hypothetical protein BCR33DRAFT_819649 [Rhizoclosmatium globosum]|eukprot:ORY20334.1 hypothetical protein BCR33DRAFT_819649 [Rhizoclosmatium globosum]
MTQKNDPVAVNPTSLTQEDVKNISELADALSKDDNTKECTEAQLDSILNPLQQTQHMLDCFSGTDMVLAIGESGHGKSTLLNAQFNSHELIVTEEGDIECRSGGFQIGKGYHSHTLFPSFLLLSNGILVVDLPGPDDTRGPYYKLLIGFIYRAFFNNKRKVKLILVQIHPRVYGRGASFQRIINSDFVSETNSIVVYTKGGTFQKPSPEDLTAEFTSKKIKSFFMPSPQQPGQYITQNKNIQDAITTGLNELTPSAPLYNCEWDSEVQILLQRLTLKAKSIAGKLVESELVGLIGANTATILWHKVSEFLMWFESDTKLLFSTLLSKLNEFGVKLDQEIFYTHINRLHLLETMNQDVAWKRSDWITANPAILQWRNIVQSSHQLRNQFRFITSDRGTTVISGISFKISDCTEYFNNDLKKVILIAYESIVIDIPVANWMDLVIISPTWEFNIKEGVTSIFNLSANKILNERPKSTDATKAERGLPGNGGGHFFAIFNHLAPRDMTQASLPSILNIPISLVSCNTDSLVTNKDKLCEKHVFILSKTKEGFYSIRSLSGKVVAENPATHKAVLKPLSNFLAPAALLKIEVNKYTNKLNFLSIDTGKFLLPDQKQNSIKFKSCQTLVFEGWQVAPAVQFLATSTGQAGGKGAAGKDAVTGVDGVVSAAQRANFVNEVVTVFWENTTIHWPLHLPEEPPNRWRINQRCRLTWTGPHMAPSPYDNLPICTYEYTMKCDGDHGSCGIDSGLRGAGGFGGYGGFMKWFSMASTKYVAIVEGNKGEMGPPGDAGISSVGGKRADTAVYETTFHFIDREALNLIVGPAAVASVVSGEVVLGGAALIGLIVSNCVIANKLNSESNRTVQYVASNDRARGGKSITDIDPNPYPQVIHRQSLSIVEIKAIFVAECVKLQEAHRYLDFSELLGQISLPSS